VEYDIVIIGAGEAGMIAAISAKNTDENTKVLIIDRKEELGGALNSNITVGYGNKYLRRNYTAPEYAQILGENLVDCGIEYKLKTTVLEINDKKEILAVNEEDGIFTIKAKAIVLANGYAEVPRGMSNIPSSRYAGVHTLGNAKDFVHKEGFLPGKSVIIYGASDISLIFARRLIIEGAKVKMVIDNNPYEPTDEATIEQYLGDFNIPLYLGYAIESLTGRERITGISICKLDEDNKMITDTREYYNCDTLIIAPKGRPNRDLAEMAKIAIDESTGGPKVNESYSTNVEGIFACGNALYIHDFLEDFSEEAMIAGKNAVLSLKGEGFSNMALPIVKGSGIQFVAPQYINVGKMEDTLELSYRVDNKFENKKLVVYFNSEKILTKELRKVIPGIKETIIIPKNLINHYKDSEKIFIEIN